MAANGKPPLHADAIVVLGCPPRRGGRPSPTLRRRVERGLELYRAGAARHLVLSGGGGMAVSEAETMRRLAEAEGIPAAAIILEPRSRNTRENARETARLLQQRGLSAVILVSDRVHLPRAALLFRWAGIEVVRRAAARPPRPMREAFAAARELAALVYTLFRLCFSRG